MKPQLQLGQVYQKILIRIPSFSFAAGLNINQDSVDNDHYKTDHMPVLSSNNHIFLEQSPIVDLPDQFPDSSFFKLTALMSCTSKKYTLSENYLKAT